MNEAGIGRLLVASLHQAIADVIPARLEFYENWLSVSGLRQGTIGLAQTAAVLSFLRAEGGAYSAIMARAGECAADWTVDGLSSIERSVVRALPVALRGRASLQIVRRLVRQTYRGSRAVVRLRRGEGVLDVRGSIFCVVREPLDHPLCGFYAAATVRLLTRFDLGADAHVKVCRGAGGAGCLIAIAIRGARVEDQRVAA